MILKSIRTKNFRNENIYYNLKIEPFFINCLYRRQISIGDIITTIKKGKFLTKGNYF